MMSALLDPESPDYVNAFQTLVRSIENPDTPMRTILHQLAKNQPSNSRAVDWGAGGGRLTRELCTLFDIVYAVEPSAGMRQVLAKTAPKAIILESSIAEAKLPESVDLGLISHVYYHIPDREWASVTLRCAAQLRDKGTLLIVLKHPDTPCNAMIEAFGAPRFNILSLIEILRGNHQYIITFQVVPGRIKTYSFDDTVTIARFMLSDRSPTAFSKSFSQRDVEDYVRRHFWDATQACGGWDLPEVVVAISPNPLMKKSGD